MLTARVCVINASGRNRLIWSVVTDQVYLIWRGGDTVSPILMTLVIIYRFIGSSPISLSGCHKRWKLIFTFITINLALHHRQYRVYLWPSNATGLVWISIHMTYNDIHIGLGTLHCLTHATHVYSYYIVIDYSWWLYIFSNGKTAWQGLYSYFQSDNRRGQLVL